MIVYPPSPSGRSCKRTVQWRHTNVQDGLVRTDPEMLSKLISTESLHKYYKLDTTPFAKGEFASVWRCKSIATGETYAAKFSSRYRYGEDCTLEIYHEIALLSLCSPSPRIIKLHDVFQTQKELIIVMEFAPGGDMQTLIDDNLVPFEKDVVKYVHDVVEALAYLHHRKIAHLDIKPQNLVMMGDFPDCEIKVCDFEISRVVLDGTEVHEILGTPEYVAPEILHYEPITLAADMWSLGVTTYVLLTGFSPFGGETDQETFLNISRAQVDFPEELFEDVSEDAKDFVKRLLRRNPKDRMSSKLALKHPWLVKARKALQAGSKTRPESRKGCATCPASNNSLRNYLSKSREALFEKVMSQGDLRKKTLIHQYNRTRRMCESQMSLCAREKLLRKESAMSRSREKLYGLKSLSKSQEVLSFYKSVLNLHDDLFKSTKDKNNASLATAVSETDEDSLKTSQVTTTPSIAKDQRLTRQEDQKEHTDTIGLARSESGSTHHAPSPTSTEATTSESEMSDEEDGFKEGEIGDSHGSKSVTPETSEPKKPPADPNEEEAEEEPKFTVAQLITAYNKHQELITKSSLEVTMQNQRFDNKTGEVFPTGPNALRLFIPDIKIRKSKPRHKKKVLRKKTGLPTVPFDLSEDIENMEINDESEDSPKQDSSPVLKGVEQDEITTPKDERVDPMERVSIPFEPSKGRQTPSPTLVPKYSPTGTSPESILTLILPEKQLESPQLVNAEESKQQPISNVAKTVELFNSLRPDRKSFCSPRSPVQPPASPEKTRRKSSPPTMKPF